MAGLHPIASGSGTLSCHSLCSRFVIQTAATARPRSMSSAGRGRGSCPARSVGLLRAVGEGEKLTADDDRNAPGTGTMLMAKLAEARFT